MKRASGHNAVLVLNTVGLGVYLVWMSQLDPRVLYAQDGVVYFLPLVPFLFVYLRAWLPSAPKPKE